MKKLALTIAAAAMIPSLGSAVTINLGFGALYTGATTNTSLWANGTGLLNLFVLTNGVSWDTPANLTSFFTTNTSSFAPANAFLLGKFSANDGQGGAGSFQGAVVYNYGTNNLAGNQPLLLVGYPTLTTSSTSPGLGTPGFWFYTTNAVDGIAWLTPSANSASVDLNALTPEYFGTSAPDILTSGAAATSGTGFTTVPEPSTYALLAMGAAALGGYVIRRRKRD